MNDELREWVATLKVRAKLIEERNWKALATEAYGFLVDAEPLAVIVVPEACSEAADVVVVGQDGVRLSARYSPDVHEPLQVVVSCQTCWADVPVGVKHRRDLYETIIENRCQTFCDECLDERVGLTPGG